MLWNQCSIVRLAQYWCLGGGSGANSEDGQDGGRENRGQTALSRWVMVGIGGYWCGRMGEGGWSQWAKFNVLSTLIK